MIGLEPTNVWNCRAGNTSALVGQRHSRSLALCRRRLRLTPLGRSGQARSKPALQFERSLEPMVGAERNGPGWIRWSTHGSRFSIEASSGSRTAWEHCHIAVSGHWGDGVRVQHDTRLCCSYTVAVAELCVFPLSSSSSRLVVATLLPRGHHAACGLDQVRKS